VGPLLRGQGPFEQRALRVVEVDPGLQVAEPLLRGGEEQGQGRQQERVDEVGHDRPGRGPDHHTEHEADQHTEHVGQDDQEQVGGRHVPDRVDSRDRRTHHVAECADPEGEWNGDDGDGDAGDRLGRDDPAAVRHQGEGRETAALAPLAGHRQDRDDREDDRHRDADRANVL
jgi:hypothetical protein